MSTDARERIEGSIFAKVISRQRPPWITVTIGLLLILAPIGAAAMDEMLVELFQQGHWRALFLSPVVILYILIVSPIMERAGSRVVQALRPVVLVDDKGFQRLVEDASRLSPIGEGVAFGAGAAFGLWVGRTWVLGVEGVWLPLYLLLSAALMFGLLGWTIYATVAGTRLTAALHRQPLHIDLFDLSPFEPVGRQSLLSALVFVAGILLAMVFGLGPDAILAWQNWLLILLLALVPVLIFFLTMRETHGVLAAQKERELTDVRRKLLRACRSLVERIDTGEATGTLAPEINALVVYEERLLAARTWPYNTAMLRTLFFSVIVPTVLALVRVVAEVVFD